MCFVFAVLAAVGGFVFLSLEVFFVCLLLCCTIHQYPPTLKASITEGGRAMNLDAVLCREIHIHVYCAMDLKVMKEDPE